MKARCVPTPQETGKNLILNCRQTFLGSLIILTSGSLRKESKYDYYLKPLALLTPQERLEVTQGPFRPLSVWPTQFFESASALVATILLYLHRKKGIALQIKAARFRSFSAPALPLP